MDHLFENWYGAREMIRCIYNQKEIREEKIRMMLKSEKTLGKIFCEIIYFWFWQREDKNGSLGRTIWDADISSEKKKSPLKWLHDCITKRCHNMMWKAANPMTWDMLLKTEKVILVCYNLHWCTVWDCFIMRIMLCFQSKSYIQISHSA